MLCDLFIYFICLICSHLFIFHLIYVFVFTLLIFNCYVLFGHP